MNIVQNKTISVIVVVTFYQAKTIWHPLQLYLQNISDTIEIKIFYTSTIFSFNFLPGW